MNMTCQHGGNGATNSKSDPDVEGFDLPIRRSRSIQHQANTRWDQDIKIGVGEFEGRLEPDKFLD